MGQTQRISKNNTVVLNEDNIVTVILHKTPVVKIDYSNRQVTFNNGGWITSTTVNRMNQAANEYGIEWRVGRTKGVMSARNYVTDEEREFNGNTLTLPI